MSAAQSVVVHRYSHAAEVEDLKTEIAGLQAALVDNRRARAELQRQLGASVSEFVALQKAAARLEYALKQIAAQYCPECEAADIALEAVTP